LNLNSFFDQYLRDIRIPTLEYKLKNKTLSYRWTNCVSDFNIPVKVTLNGKEQWLKPQTKWTSLRQKVKNLKVEVDNNFYVDVVENQ